MVASFNPSWKGIVEGIHLAVLAAGGTPSVSHYPQNMRGAIAAVDDLRAAIVTIGNLAAVFAAHTAAADPHPQYASDTNLRAHNRASAPHSGHATTAALTAHTAATNNPHGVTAAQVGAELSGAVAAHASALDPHPQYATDADLVTHASAATPHSGHATLSGLNAHIGNANNPHGVTAAQVGAPTTAALTAHTAATNNPHGVTAAQVGAELSGAVATHVAAADPHSVYATDTDLATHTGASAPHSGHATTAALTAHAAATNNPHGVTAAQVGAESSGAVATHAAVAANVHGLPAGASVLGTKMGAGRYTQGGQATVSGGLGALALAQYRDVAVLFPSAFATAPRVFVTGASGYPAAALNITTTGFTARVFGELSLAATHTINYLAIGT